jgi:hypothetical protein
MSIRVVVNSCLVLFLFSGACSSGDPSLPGSLGTSQQALVTCDEDSDCGLQACLNGNCTNGCHAESECHPGANCVDRECVLDTTCYPYLPPACASECFDDNDCSPFAWCGAGICHEP